MHLLGFFGAVICTVGCANPRHAMGPQGTTTIHVVGPPGATITGSFVQHGYRVPLGETALPFRLSEGGISEVIVRKTHPQATLALAAQHNEDVDFWQTISQARDGVAGLRLRVADGVVVDKLTR